MDSFTVIPGLESQVTSPLLLVQGEAYNGRYGSLLGGLPRGPPAGSFEDLHSRGLGGGRFRDPQGGDGFKDARGSVTKAGKGTADRSKSDSRPFTTRQKQGGHTLYGPHNPGTQIYGGGLLLEGPRDSSPTGSASRPSAFFTMYTTKSNLPRMVKGGYYVKENDTHGYSKLCLLPEAVALAPEGLLQTPNSVTAWKAIIRQLEDQLTEGAMEPGGVAMQATGLAEFALRVQQTPYAATPMQARRCAHSKEGDKTASKGDEGTLERPQRLEDSIDSLWGEIGV
jgi:hypothetical protein